VDEFCAEFKNLEIPQKGYFEAIFKVVKNGLST
jgi:hypothetical protein